MTNAQKRLELNKILSSCSRYAVLDGTKSALENLTPCTEVKTANDLLETTEECSLILYRYGGGKVEYFPSLTDELTRVQKGSSLSFGELLGVCSLLRSARLACKACDLVTDREMPALTRLTARLYFDKNLEEDIESKIISDCAMSDTASERLYALRKDIKLLNERIRARLSEYLTGDTAKYLQENIVTMRGERYVLPVKTEYKRSVKGFIHDKSQTGATVFIEPAELLEMNNELRSLTLDEKEEVERILKELSLRVGGISENLKTDVEILCEMDGFFARAEYAYRTRSIRPLLNDRGVINIIRGRHPLIDKDKVIPVTLSLGEDYQFLLISGPNTGGKTVTLKMTGLFCLMASCGLFVPAMQGTELAIFKAVYCDVGDAQSIEESLSTFSSHITNIIEITNHAQENSLVLIDELGGGTDPEEGQALARAVTEHLIKQGAKGIITTHYTPLKEFAYEVGGIENACMEFDANTLQPLYKIKIGLPGSSNALLISRRLGLKDGILQSALNNLSEGTRRFENILRQAEETRLIAEREREIAEGLKLEWQEKLSTLERERERLEKDKENFFTKAKSEARRIVNERTARAEELLAEIEEIFEQEEINQADLIRARTLKNKLADTAYESGEEESVPKYVPVDERTLKAGERVFVVAMGSEGVIRSLRNEKKEAEVEVNGIRVRIKFSALKQLIIDGGSNTQSKKTPQKTKNKRQNTGNNRVGDSVKVVKNVSSATTPRRELNVIGLTVAEALQEIDGFLDGAIVSGIEEVKIIHGFGMGRLKKGIHEYLRTHTRVESYRLGIYGEGEGGVTFVRLK